MENLDIVLQKTLTEYNKEVAAKFKTLRGSIPSLSGYATEQWVKNQKYLTAVSWDSVSGKPSWIGASKPSYAFSEITSKPTTLSGYGITDAKIANGVITLGSNTITPLTSVDLNGISDVTITNVAKGQVLSYDGSKWVNSAFQAGVDESMFANYVMKTGDTMTGKLIINRDSAGVHLGFGRPNVNYIAATSEGGEFAFVTNGLVATLAANATLILTGKNGRPGTTNDGSWGISTHRWSNIYSVLGNFSGQITSTVAKGTSPLVITSNTLVTNLNADLLDGQQGEWYQKNAMHFRVIFSNPSNASYDLNTDLKGGGVANWYGSGGLIVENRPETTYGAVLEIATRDNSQSLAGQLLWNVNHGKETPTKNLWWRAADSNGFQNDWHQIAFTDSNVASASQLQTSRKLWGQSFDGTADVNGDISLSTTAASPLTISLTNSEGDVALRMAGSGNRGMADVTRNQWILGYNGTATFLLCDNVGIGTSSPSYKLHVSGTGAFTDTLSVLNTTAKTHLSFARNGYNYVVAGEENGTLDFVAGASGGATANVTLHVGNKKVGIATVSPQYTLHVNGTLYAKGDVTFASSLSSGQIIAIGEHKLTKKGGTYKDPASGIEAALKLTGVLAQGGGDTLLCTDSGNVGVGTTIPSYKMHIVGNTYIQGNLTVTGDSTLNLPTATTAKDGLLNSEDYVALQKLKYYVTFKAKTTSSSSQFSNNDTIEIDEENSNISLLTLNAILRNNPASYYINNIVFRFNSGVSTFTNCLMSLVASYTRAAIVYAVFAVRGALSSELQYIDLSIPSSGEIKILNASSLKKVSELSLSDFSSPVVTLNDLQGILSEEQLSEIEMRIEERKTLETEVAEQPSISLNINEILTNY